MAARKSTSQSQVQLLRRKLWLGLVIRIGVFTAAFLVVIWVFDVAFSDRLGDVIADMTSTWITIPQDSFEGFGLDTDLAYSQFIYDNDNDTIRFRDLTVYNVIKNLKYPLIILLYLIGCIIIAFVTLNRSIRYFAELSDAVGGLMANKNLPVKLSPELAVTESELNAIRLSSRADEYFAAQAEERKNEMVAYLAHDIRTPLTSVLGYLSLLSEGTDLPTETRQKYADIALEKAERLEKLVEEFFEITRYNLQAIPIERANVDLLLFCNQVADEFYPEASSRGIAIEVKAPENVTVFIDGDKLARAVGNVLRNAVAYADDNTTIRMFAFADEYEFKIDVTDRGREISDVHLQNIFQRFYRVEGARSTDKGGAGLGLAIAKEIVQAHGGTIEAESENGTTTFTIVCPR